MKVALVTVWFYGLPGGYPEWIKSWEPHAFSEPKFRNMSAASQGNQGNEVIGKNEGMAMTHASMQKKGMHHEGMKKSLKKHMMKRHAMRMGTMKKNDMRRGTMAK